MKFRWSFARDLPILGLSVAALGGVGLAWEQVDGGGGTPLGIVTTHEQARSTLKLLLWYSLLNGGTTTYCMAEERIGNTWWRLALFSSAAAVALHAHLVEATIAETCLFILPPWIVGVLIVSRAFDVLANMLSERYGAITLHKAHKEVASC